MALILDLPEPSRSDALAEIGMTAEEYTAHSAGLIAAAADAERMIEAGEMERATDMHYEVDLPGVRVVDLSKE